MKKPICLLLAICLTAALLAGCSPDNSGTQVQEKSAFTANIDRYWQEHDIDSVLAEQGFSEEDLAPIRAEMLAMYGENKEIQGDYDKDLAAKTVSGIYVGKADADNVVSWKGIPYAKQPVGDLRWKAPQSVEASNETFAQFADPSCNGASWPEYSLEKRETMIFNDDGTTNIENDPLSNQRELIAHMSHK